MGRDVGIFVGRVEGNKHGSLDGSKSRTEDGRAFDQYTASIPCIFRDQDLVLVNVASGTYPFIHLHLFLLQDSAQVAPL